MDDIDQVEEDLRKVEAILAASTGPRLRGAPGTNESVSARPQVAPATPAKSSHHAGAPAAHIPSKLLSLEERQKIIKGLLAERKARDQQQHRQQQQMQHHQPSLAAALSRPSSAASEQQMRVQQMLNERHQARPKTLPGAHQLLSPTSSQVSVGGGSGANASWRPNIQPPQHHTHTEAMHHTSSSIHQHQLTYQQQKRQQAQQQQPQWQQPQRPHSPGASSNISLDSALHGAPRMAEHHSGPVDISTLWGGGSAASLPRSDSLSDGHGEGPAAGQTYHEPLQQFRQGHHLHTFQQQQQQEDGEQAWHEPRKSVTFRDPSPQPTQRSSSSGDDEYAASTTPNRHSREAIQRQIEHERRQELTFKPDTSRSRKNIAKTYVGGERRIHELSQPRTAYWEKHARAKMEAEQARLSEATFKPQTGRGPRHRVQQSVPVQERLYTAHDAIKQERERRLQEQEQQALAECTFQPRINSKSMDLLAYRPIHERLGEVLRQRHERMMRSKVVAEREQGDNTFRPQLNRRSLQLVESRRQQSGDSSEDGWAAVCGFSSRASSPRQRPEPHRSSSAPLVRRARSEAALAELERDMTFSPNINPATDKLLMRSGQPLDFMERQKAFLQQQQLKKAALQAALQDRECSFKPDTGYTDLYLAGSSRSAMVQESFMERVERLAYADKQRKESTQQARSQHYYSQYTFKPSINPRSRAMAMPTPLEELHQDSRTKKKREALVQAAEAQLAAECRFAPDTSQSANVVKDQRRGLGLSQDGQELSQRIGRYQELRQQRLQEALGKQQYEELKECTFTPQVNSELPATTSAQPVTVRGLNRHLELRALAKQREQQQKEREDKVFMRQPKGNPSLFTVPQPFNLRSEEMRRSKDAKAQQQPQQYSECTFKPRTGVQEKRQLLQHILASEDDWL